MPSPDPMIASSGPFPFEIIQGIVYYLTHDWIGPNGENPPLFGFRSWGPIRGAARYATVNKAWQVAVERETFAELHLDHGRLIEADAILNWVPRRHKYVRTIRLNVVLPRSDSAPPHVESAEERKQRNRALQRTFEAFVSTLSHWTPGPPVKLCLDAFALTNKGDREEELPSVRARRAMFHLPLELEDPERLLRHGPVNVITEVDMERNRLIGKRISAAAVCTLVARLPAAKKVSINWWDIRGHSEARSAFAQALTNVTHAIDSFHIAGTYSQPNHQQPARQPDRHEAKPDELSQSLGMISQRLRHLDLYDVIVSDDLFLQHSLAPEVASPAHWARLENFYLYYPPIAPSGKWLFYPDPSVLDRQKAPTVVDPAIQRRYLAAARAALEMPLLVDMLLEAHLEGDGDWHKFWYHRNTKGNAATAIWTSSSGFVPDDKVLAAWREVPRKHWETELEVKILDDEYAA
ncbi:hypothetical protein F5Y13DRAFT_169281 [Hypoxylon sp. FL1857]|nr:hypothetical protein F5Y13DRAFT_169281 [Hypoxylon sp. FL1857]